ncbi:hypothetical protein BN1095_6470002 [Clostridioides difficile]|uniref:Uncharacterized protein n=1 Tax=Clostridioides difficile TaxID=1496 RepID=A0A069AYC9_CLODI|nr:hypothetical protein BN1095_6470002 [Clostridioides difficile]
MQGGIRFTSALNDVYTFLTVYTPRHYQVLLEKFDIFINLLLNPFDNQFLDLKWPNLSTKQLLNLLIYSLISL